MHVESSFVADVSLRDAGYTSSAANLLIPVLLGGWLGRPAHMCLPVLVI